jgi:hypothetical protein
MLCNRLLRVGKKRQQAVQEEGLFHQGWWPIKLLKICHTRVVVGGDFLQFLLQIIAHF